MVRAARARCEPKRRRTTHPHHCLALAKRYTMMRLNEAILQHDTMLEHGHNETRLKHATVGARTELHDLELIECCMGAA
eukprot:10551650-Lingulodinium_polyedra.AAC.1